MQTLPLTIHPNGAASTAVTVRIIRTRNSVYALTVENYQPKVTCLTGTFAGEPPLEYNEWTSDQIRVGDALSLRDREGRIILQTTEVLDLTHA